MIKIKQNFLYKTLFFTTFSSKFNLIQDEKDKTDQLK